MPDATTAPRTTALLDLTGTVAIVTGGGAGIGAAVAARFAEAGAQVAVHYRTSESGARETVRAIESRGGRAVAFPADLTRPGQAAALVERTLDAFGSIGVVVNNAGAYPLSALVAMTEAEWDEVVAANLKSVHLMTQAAARAMIAAGRGGAIVNVASIEASRPAPMHAHYNAAKAGVVMHTRAAALELGPAGIRVNAVSPGLIWREGLEEAWPDGVARYLKRAPLGRLGRAVEVADACLFLASPAARWITGAELVVDGGVLASAAF